MKQQDLPITRTVYPDKDRETVPKKQLDPSMSYVVECESCGDYGHFIDFILYEEIQEWSVKGRTKHWFCSEKCLIASNL